MKLRLDREQELSFLEFNYMILQAYDFVELAQALRLQCCRWAARTSGATSSTASISAGAWERAALRADLAADHHLVGRQDGQDRGRRGVAQRRHAVSPYDYWQFWRNTEDGDVARFLKLFTTLPLDEIARLARAAGPGDQRGEEGARHRGDRAAARPRGGRAGRRNRAHDLRGRRGRREPADRRSAARRTRERVSACSARSPRRPGLSHRTARRGVRSRAAG